VPRVDYEQLTSDRPGEPSKQMRARVEAAQAGTSAEVSHPSTSRPTCKQSCNNRPIPQPRSSAGCPEASIGPRKVAHSLPSSVESSAQSQATRP
jgi:hypothetical protein